MYQFCMVKRKSFNRSVISFHNFSFHSYNHFPWSFYNYIVLTIISKTENRLRNKFFSKIFTISVSDTDVFEKIEKENRFSYIVCIYFLLTRWNFIFLFTNYLVVLVYIPMYIYFFFLRWWIRVEKYEIAFSSSTPELLLNASRHAELGIGSECIYQEISWIC